jgi:hypothetical protein
MPVVFTMQSCSPGEALRFEGGARSSGRCHRPFVRYRQIKGRTPGLEQAAPTMLARARWMARVDPADIGALGLAI